MTLHADSADTRSFLARRIDATEARWKSGSLLNLAVLLPFVFAVFVCFYQWKVDRAISQRERMVIGTIASHEIANHNQWSYVFSVDGVSYNGIGKSRKGDLNIGEQVQIYYDPMDPKQSALTDFSELSSSNLGPVPILLVLIAAVTYGVLRVRRQNSIALQKTQHVDQSMDHGKQI